ncbi:MAG: magnesium transporter [Acidimicrobiia bacterium]
MASLAELIEAGDVDALHEWLGETGVLETSEELARLDPDDKGLAFRLLPRDRALEVFELLDPPDQQQVLEGLRADRVRHIVESMDPDDRARLLDEMPAMVAHRLIGQLSPHERELTNVLLGYPPESAGRVMSPEFVSLHADMTVEEALAKVRQAGRAAETIYALPVTDGHRRLVGVVSLKKLVLEDTDAVVGDLMATDVHSVRVTDDQEYAARLIQEADLLALPVVDGDERIVGVFTFDDAMEVIEREETEDIARQSATTPLGRPYMSASAFGLARARATWLLVLIVAAGLTVQVLQHFEVELATVVTLALFIPLLSGTGGNSGSQAAVAVIRAMALGEVRFPDLPRVIWREARVGLMLGLMLGAASLIPVGLFFGSDMATVVGLTLVAICTWATLAGSMLPLLAQRFGVDPTVVSAPLITTLVDATGLIIYFLIARAVLDLTG